MNVEKITKKQIFDEQYKQFVNVNGQFLQRFIANEIVNKLNIICDYSESTSHFKLSLQYDNKNILTEPIYIPHKYTYIELCLRHYNMFYDIIHYNNK